LAEDKHLEMITYCIRTGEIVVKCRLVLYIESIVHW